MHNFFRFRAFERTLPIFFQKLVTSEDESVEDYMKKKSEIFGLASTHCLPQIIHLSGALNKKNLAKHIQFFRERLHGLPTRLADIYSIYRHFAFEVMYRKKECLGNPHQPLHA